MPGQEYSAAVLLDRVEGLVETAMRVQVEQAVHFLKVWHPRSARGSHRWRHRHAAARLSPPQVRPAPSLIAFPGQRNRSELRDRDRAQECRTKPPDDAPAAWRRVAPRPPRAPWPQAPHALAPIPPWPVGPSRSSAPGRLRFGSLGSGRWTILLTRNRLALCRYALSRLPWRLVPHIPSVSQQLTLNRGHIDGESHGSPISTPNPRARRTPNPLNIGPSVDWSLFRSVWLRTFWVGFAPEDVEFHAGFLGFGLRRR